MASILVAEDDAALRLLYTMWLESAGHRVTAVADGRAAIATIQRLVPEAAVLDVEMPFVDGLAVGRYLHGLAPDVPILFVTALEGLDAGRAEVLPKPCGRDLLVQALENARTIASAGREAVPM
ncbi:MAG TPA: response regulator [Gaiellaceae bacterium]|nr:response regulator [Gaiellaceae bacterium]